MNELKKEGIDEVHKAPRYEKKTIAKRQREKESNVIFSPTSACWHESLRM
jgi:superfamily I DNA and/or RNA helicase